MLLVRNYLQRKNIAFDYCTLQFIFSLIRKSTKKKKKNEFRMARAKLNTLI